MVKQATCFFKVFLCKLLFRIYVWSQSNISFHCWKGQNQVSSKCQILSKNLFWQFLDKKWFFSEMIIYSSFIFYFPVASLFRFWPKIVLFDFFEKRCASVDRTPRFCVAVINAQLRCHLFLRNVKNAPFVWSAIFGISSVFQNEANYRFFLTFDQKWSFLL